MEKLQKLRDILGPLAVNSGYRCPEHPEEAKKPLPGAHAQGTAADIAVNSASGRYRVVKEAVTLGFVGIGIANSFIHVDTGHDTATRPALWKY